MIHAQQQKSFRHLMANGIKRSALDEFESFLRAPGTLSRPSLIIRCQVAYQGFSYRVVVDKPVIQRRLKECFLPFLDGVLHRTIANADFFVLISDNLYVEQEKEAEFVEFLKRVPLLRCDQRNQDEVSSHTILIPDFFLQRHLYSDKLTAIQKADEATAFDERFELIKWRGALHGPHAQPNLENLRDFPRYTLLKMSLLHPDIVDARLTTYDNICGSESADRLKQQLQEIFGNPAEYQPIESFVRYKYLISIDGVCSSWERVPYILASGSVLLLQHRWNQFFYPGLKPWEHYVPLKDDVSDLVERYKWLIVHPFEAKAIAENAQHFAREILHPATLGRFLAEIVNQCGELYSH